MRCLLYLNICLFLFTACSPRLMKGYRKGEKLMVNKETVPPVLQPAEGVNRYNMTFDFRKNHFSGMLLIKQTGDDKYRFLYNSHFGLSLFDIEISPDTFEIHQCVEPMQNKNLFKLLQRDFTLLLGIRQRDVEEALSYLHPDKPAYPAWKLTSPEIKGIYISDTENTLTEKVLSGSGFGKALICRAKGTNNEEEIILIKHCWINLLLTIQPLK